MIEHTPGPSGAMTHPRGAANAELIARAPDMAEEIERLRLKLDAYTERTITLETQRDELLALCERATIESARVHPEFMAALRTAIKATKADR